MQTDTPTRLSPELIRAAINVHVCQLEVLAARTALEYWRERNATRDAAWRDFGSFDRD
jgi:hypothetical protein